MVQAQDSAERVFSGMPYFKQKEPFRSHWDTEKAKRTSAELDFGTAGSQAPATRRGWKGRMPRAGAAFRGLQPAAPSSSGRCAGGRSAAQRRHPHNTPGTPKDTPGAPPLGAAAGPSGSPPGHQVVL